jgi:hypothetical protein
MWRDVKRIGAAIVGVVALNAGVAHATVPPEAPDPVDVFTLWSVANGLALTRVACSETDVITCYGMDSAQATTTATMNSDGSFTVISPVPSASTATTVTPTGAATGVGTRDNPVPIGTSADVGEGWTLSVNEVTLDATALVTGANMFNDPPPEGSVYVMVNITMAYNGPDDKAIDFFTVSGVTSSNVELNTFDNFVVAPDAYDGLAEVFAGGSKSGNIVFTVPAAEVDSLVLYTSAGFGGDDVYFATRQS